jgi:hypothetical protein
VPRIARPSPAMAVALVALFVALGGTGYAVARIDGRQLRNATVSGAKLRKNTLGGREVRESRLGRVPRAARADTAARALAADRATTAATADRATSADRALALSDGAVAGLTLARSGAAAEDAQCHPEDTVDKPLLVCASVTMTLPRAGRALLVGTAAVGKGGTGVPYVAGCVLQADGATVAGSLTHGGQDFDTTPGMHFGATPFGIATTAVTNALAAGAHTFAIACQQADPDALVVDAKISALVVGAG